MLIVNQIVIIRNAIGGYLSIFIGLQLGIGNPMGKEGGNFFGWLIALIWNGWDKETCDSQQANGFDLFHHE